MAEENTGPDSGPALVPQPHGGALLNGGVPGNKGGGRPPSELRKRMRGSLDERLHIAEEIADDGEQRATDRMRALDFLAKYGIGQQHHHVSQDGVIALMREAGEVVGRLVEDEDVVEQIKQEWIELLRGRFGS